MTPRPVMWPRPVAMPGGDAGAPLRRPLALAMVILVGLPAALLGACGRSAEPGPGATAAAASSALAAPATSTVPSAAEPLALGEPATVGAFVFTPAAVHDRPGPVYDAQGVRMAGTGVQVPVVVEKLREPETGSGDGAELAVPVARLVGAAGQQVEADQLFGLPPAQAQSTEFNGRYAGSYQFACIQPVGTVTKALLWFSVPRGFVPQRLVIDAGAGQQAAWRLD